MWCQGVRLHSRVGFLSWIPIWDSPDGAMDSIQGVVGVARCWICRGLLDELRCVEGHFPARGALEHMWFHYSWLVLAAPRRGELEKFESHEKLKCYITYIVYIHLIFTQITKIYKTYILHILIAYSS